VAETRDELEQQAMLLLQKDKKEEALDVYLKILKLSKGDIRVRQKLADLYLQLGKKPEAIRQLRDVATGQMKEGQHRAAVVVLKRLHELNPTDAPTLAQLGEAQKAVGFIEEAKEAFTKVIDMLQPKPKLALQYVQELIAISPGEIPPKVMLAEVLSRCGQTDESFDQWMKLGREARRRGSTLDQAQFMERGLKLKENNAECLEGAAEARIALGAPKDALVHIQKAYAVDPNSTRVLSMLAQCFELMEQQPKAKKVLMQLAKVHEENQDVVERLEVLKRAAACDPDDAALQSEVGTAVALAERVQMRVHEQEWSQPQNEEEANVVVRAAILARYGFPDRAKTVLESSNGTRETVSVRAILAEVHAQLGDVEAALTELSQIAGDGSTDVQTRISVLKGNLDGLAEDVDAAPVEMEIDVDDEEMELEMDEEEAMDEVPEPLTGGTGEPGVDHESEGDRLAAAGDTNAAIAAYQAALESDPTNESVLMKLGELFAADTGDVAPPVTPEPAMDLPSFGSIERSAPAVTQPVVPSSVALDDGYMAIRGMIMLGKLTEAKQAAEERSDLLGACAVAELLSLEGDAKQARRVLQEAMDEVDEDAAGYPEGLWGLARYAAMVGKVRTAVRLLGELEDLAPGHRSSDIAVLRIAIDG
jgi:tetratricopeptide (TPR) repeat protein